MVRRRSRSCGYEWVLQVRILEVPRQVVRYESSSAKLNRLGRMQVRNKAKSTPREQEDDEEAAGGGAGREGVREIGEERAGAGGGGTNQPLADKKQGKNLAGLISSLLLLLPLNRSIAQSPSLSLCPSLSVSVPFSGSPLCLQLVTVAVSSKSQDEDEIGAVAWSARAGKPRLPNAHLLICEGATVGDVGLDAANGSSSSVPAEVGLWTHRQGWGSSESVSLAASPSRDHVGIQVPYLGTVQSSVVQVLFFCLPGG